MDELPEDEEQDEPKYYEPEEANEPEEPEQEEPPETLEQENGYEAEPGEEEPEVYFDPNELFEPTQQKFSVDYLPGTIEKRVFIAGDYRLKPVLVEIRDYVSALGFQPILAADFEMPRDKTRDYSIRMLFQCRYAIFELTIQGGQTVEFEKAHSSGLIKILGVFMASDEQRKLPTSMLATEPPPRGYLSFGELKALISSFLTLSQKPA